MTDIAQEDTLTEEIQFEDLDCFWMDNGLPVFIGNYDNICEIVESMGFSIYYILTNNLKTSETTSTNSTTKVVTKTTTVTRNMQLYKVVNNFVGRSVSLSNDPFSSDFVQLKEEALYTMPAIPHVIVDKLDQFFRLVDAQHGTESIVMLTYDMDKEGPQGWGILVPDQANTAVHCNYDPNSVAEIKPDNVMIVGSVHSHPGMSAYASGTDHQDQADFDGLHITYGWQKSVNNGATQYHIELQMAGKAYTLKPEDVFEDFTIDKEPDPEVVGWSTKVKKELPPSWGGYQTEYRHPLPTGTQDLPLTHGTASPTKENKLSGLDDLRKRFHQVNDFNIENNAIVVAEVDSYNNGELKTFCPSCGTVLDEFNFFNTYCDFCYIPIAERDTPVDTIIMNVAQYCKDLYIDEDCPLYLWSIDKDGTQALMKIVENSISENVKKILVDELITTDSYGYSSRPDIDPQLLFEFDDLTRRIQFYSKDSECSSCQHYYDVKCPAFIDILNKWVEDPQTNLHMLEETIHDDGCNMYELYSSYQNTYSTYDDDR
jgi:hypothetical protein